LSLRAITIVFVLLRASTFSMRSSSFVHIRSGFQQTTAGARVGRGILHAMNLPGRSVILGVVIIAAIALAVSSFYVVHKPQQNAPASSASQPLQATGQQSQPSLTAPAAQAPQFLQRAQTGPTSTSNAWTRSETKAWHIVFTYNATDTDISYSGDYYTDGYFKLSGSQARIRYYCTGLDAQNQSDATLSGDIVAAEASSSFTSAFATDARCGSSHTISYENVPPATYFLAIIIPAFAPEDYNVEVDDYY
jgi:hypothetical protein